MEKIGEIYLKQRKIVSRLNCETQESQKINCHVLRRNQPRPVKYLFPETLETELVEL
jgi:hypothetical protein